MKFGKSNKSDEVSLLRREVEYLRRESGRQDRVDREIARRQLQLLKSQQRKERLETLGRVVRKGFKMMSPQPISKEQYHDLYWSTDRLKKMTGRSKSRR